MLRACESFRPDLILAIKGATLDIDLLREVRATTKAPLVMYSTDNPFNAVVSSRSWFEALGQWDAIATPRRNNIAALKEHCAGDVFYLPFGYDPAVHYPEKVTPREQTRYRSDVVFVGSCDPDRVPFLDRLASAEDLAVSFYGPYFRDTEAIRKRARGFAEGRAYRVVLSTTAVALTLVRRANEDGHVMRTFEVPACGAFMLAERTEDHQEMFEEDRDAVFFDSPEELADKAAYYVRNTALRVKIAASGFRRVTENPNTYVDRLASVLARLGAK
jgi:spore maturation protein CgeB